VSKWEYKYFGKGLFSRKVNVKLKEVDGKIIKCDECLKAEERTNDKNR